MYIIYNKGGKNRILRAEIVEKEMPTLGTPIGPFLTNVELQFETIKTQFQFTATYGLLETWFLFPEMPIFYKTEKAVTRGGKIIEQIVEGQHGKARLQKFHASYFGTKTFAAKISEGGSISMIMEKNGQTYGVPMYNFYPNGGTCVGSVEIDRTNPMATFLNFMSAQMKPHMVFDPRVDWKFNGKQLEPDPKEFSINPIGEKIPAKAQLKPTARLMPM